MAFAPLVVYTTLWELEERVAQAGAQARPREQRPQTPGGAVEAIGEDPFDPIRRLLLRRGALKLAIGLGKGRRACLLSVPEMPEHAATDNRGQIHLVGETAAVLLIGEDIDRQRQPTSGQHGHQTGVTKRTDEAVERHGREMVE